MKIDWSKVWGVFFTIFTTVFAVFVMLKLTKTGDMSWFTVLIPVMIEVAVPAVVLLGAFLVGFLKGVFGDKRE